MAQGKGNPETNKKVATSALVTTLLSGVGFYLGNRYWEAVVSFGGQFFEHWGDGFAAMWPLIAENPAHIDMSPNAMLAGLTMCVLVWLFWLRYVAFVGNFRAGEESGSARWGTLKEGKQFRDLTTEDNNLIFTQNFGLALHRPKFNPELDRNLNVLVVGGSGSGFCEAAYQTPPPMRAIASSPPSPAITAFFLSNSWPKSTMMPFFPSSSPSVGTCGICCVPISCLSLSKSFLSSMTNLPFNPAPRARRILQFEPICMLPHHPHKAKSCASSSLRVTRTSARRCEPR